MVATTNCPKTLATLPSIVLYVPTQKQALSPATLCGNHYTHTHKHTLICHFKVKTEFTHNN